MRSKNLFKNSTLISMYVNKRLGAFFTFCCMLLYPNFDLLADGSQFEAPSLLNAASLRTKIYFYNPEINTARNLVLKNTWDKYLYALGDYEFQPVDDETEFIRLVQDQTDAAFIMADWFYASLFSSKATEHNLNLAFQGIRNGKDTYSKILIANKSSLDLENVTIACSGSKDRAKDILSSIYPELSTHQLDKLNILLVPKDIDALMAVGYGLAEMALSTEVGLSKMSRLNKNLYKDMIVLRESKPLKRSVLVFKSTNSVLKSSLARLMMNMAKTSDGHQAMNLLGLDEWKVKPIFSAQISKHIKEDTNKKGGQHNDN